jgi:hypothetical protein
MKYFHDCCQSVHVKQTTQDGVIYKLRHEHMLDEDKTNVKPSAFDSYSMKKHQFLMFVSKNPEKLEKDDAMILSHFSEDRQFMNWMRVFIGACSCKFMIDYMSMHNKYYNFSNIIHFHSRNIFKPRPFQIISWPAYFMIAFYAGASVRFT